MTRALAVAASLLVGASVLGACGSSGDGGGENDGNAATATTSAPAVAIEDFAFSPDALRVKAGTKVTFTNRDGFDHTVTATDKSFDSGHLPEDGTFERTFDAPGTYPYLCSIHNSMTGSVVVS
jgi:plastocyanin